MLLASVLMVVAACGDRREPNAAVDSSLARDLTLAGSATSTVAIGDTAVSTPTAPTPTPVPPTPTAAPRPAPPRPVAVARPAPRATTRPQTSAPTRTPAPAPVPAEPTPSAAPTPAPAAAPAPGPAPARGSLGSGALLSGNTNAAICSLANRPGDRFVVSLASRVTGSNGAVLEAGTPVLIELATAGTDGFTFRLRGVQVNGEFLPAEGSVSVGEATYSERSVSGGNDKGKVVTGAIAGAILGRVLGGGGKGTVIGAAGGAAAGTIAAQRSRVSERCMAAGAPIAVTLSAPLVLPNPAP